MLLVKFCFVFPMGTSLSHLLCGGWVDGAYFGICSKRRIIYLDKRRCSQWGSSSVLRGLRDWYASKTTPSGVRPQYLEVFAQRHSPSHHIGIKFVYWLVVTVMCLSALSIPTPLSFGVSREPYNRPRSGWSIRLHSLKPSRTYVLSIKVEISKV